MMLIMFSSLGSVSGVASPPRPSAGTCILDLVSFLNPVWRWLRTSYNLGFERFRSLWESLADTLSTRVSYAQTTCELILMRYYGYSRKQAALWLQKHPACDLQGFVGADLLRVLGDLDRECVKLRSHSIVVKDLCLAFGGAHLSRGWWGDFATRWPADALPFIACWLRQRSFALSSPSSRSHYCREQRAVYSKLTG